MNRRELNNRYFKWMCELVSDSRAKKLSYSKLLKTLHNIDFRYSIEMDGNRAEDGIDLRYRFGYENSLVESIVALYLDDRPCSVLEMMIALSIRCEEQIMGDPDIGNKPGKWFWIMIDNLGLIDMDNSHYDENYIYETVNRFLERKYDKYGSGGLFKLKNHYRDIRSVEIWYQMMWYLDDILKD